MLPDWKKRCVKNGEKTPSIRTVFCSLFCRPICPIPIFESRNIHVKPNNFDFLRNYCRKCKRGGPPNFPGVTWGYIKWSWLGAFIGIFLVAFITYRTEVSMMIGSFGASAVLLFAAYQVPLAQPRNLIGGARYLRVGGRFYFPAIWEIRLEERHLR